MRCMFPPLSQHQSKGDPTVPRPLQMSKETGSVRVLGVGGRNRVKLTGREFRWGERIQRRVRKEQRIRGGACECACR